jgi:hypothetical protein
LNMVIISSRQFLDMKHMLLPWICLALKEKNCKNKSPPLFISITTQDFH